MRRHGCRMPLPCRKGALSVVYLSPLVCSRHGTQLTGPALCSPKALGSPSAARHQHSLALNVQTVPLQQIGQRWRRPCGIKRLACGEGSRPGGGEHGDCKPVQKAWVMQRKRGSASSGSSQRPHFTRTAPELTAQRHDRPSTRTSLQASCPPSSSTHPAAGRRPCPKTAPPTVRGTHRG